MPALHNNLEIALAQRFVEEIERWRLSLIEEPSPIATDSVTQGQPVVLENQGGRAA